MNKILTVFIIFLMLSSCDTEKKSTSNFDKDFGGFNGGPTGAPVNNYNSDFDGTVENKNLPTNFTASVSDSCNPDSYYDENDIVENISFYENVIKINLSEIKNETLLQTDTGTVKITGDSSGAKITSDVSEKIIYELTGKMTGTLEFECADTNGATDFKLIMNGAEIEAVNGKALAVNSASKVFMVLNGNTENIVSDTTDGKKAALFVAGSLIISGNGNLKVTGNKKNGIVVEDYIRIRGGNISVKSTAKDCIRAINKFIFDNGTLTLNGTGTEIGDESKGIKVDGTDGSEEDGNSNANVAGLGFIVVNGGTINITTVGKAMTASWEWDEDGDLINGEYEPNPFVKINNGIIKITTTGIPYEYTEDGTEYSLSPEGIEGKSSVIINGGCLTLKTTDDAINAANHVEINGGYIYAYASQNDAIDSNGTFEMNDGIVVAFATYNPECAIDCDHNAPIINGGYLATLSTNNYSAPSASGCGQNTIIIGSSSAGSNTTIALVDSDNNADFAFKVPDTGYSVMIISSPKIGNGAYTLYKDVTVAGDKVFSNLYLGDISVSGGNSVASCTVTSTLTTIGSISSGGAMEGIPGKPNW